MIIKLIFNKIIRLFFEPHLTIVPRICIIVLFLFFIQSKAKLASSRVLIIDICIDLDVHDWEPVGDAKVCNFSDQSSIGKNVLSVSFLQKTNIACLFATYKSSYN